MAKRDQKKALRQALAGLGLGGAYTQLINKAIRNGWDAQEFVVALTRTKTFKTRFPGLIQNGRINDFLAGGRDGITVGNLASAVGNYKRLQEGYQDIAEVQGLTQFKVGPQRMKALIGAEISPEEFGRRAFIQTTVQNNPALEAWYNQVRKEAGLKPVDKVGLFKDLVNRQSKFYDLHEAAQLGLSGLYSAKEALSLAKGIGAPGTMTDLTQLVATVKQHRGDIGPELERAGIDNAKLTRFLDNPGSDPDNLAATLNTILANRRRMGQGQSGVQGSEGSGGGLSLYRERESQSY